MSTSSSIFTRWPTSARARSTAGAMPPAMATWLSLISMASSRPKRWLMPPPTRTAYFCAARSPGIVLRVQTICALCAGDRVDDAARGGGDAATGGTGSSARCARRSGCRAPGRLSVAIGVAAAPGGCRPAQRARCAIAGSIRRNASQREIEPGDDARLARDQRASRPRASAGTIASVVMSPARPRSSSSAARTSGSIMMREGG